MKTVLAINITLSCSLSSSDVTHDGNYWHEPVHRKQAAGLLVEIAATVAKPNLNSCLRAHLTMFCSGKVSSFEPPQALKPSASASACQYSLTSNSLARGQQTKRKGLPPSSTSNIRSKVKPTTSIGQWGIAFDYFASICSFGLANTSTLTYKTSSLSDEISLVDRQYLSYTFPAPQRIAPPSPEILLCRYVVLVMVPIGSQIATANRSLFMAAQKKHLLHLLQ